MGQIIRIRKKKWDTGVTRRYEYRGVRYEVSSVFRPFLMPDDKNSDEDGTMYSNLSAGKECNADKI